MRPTYVVTWEMATRPESASVLRDLARTGRCEIGTHLHPWSSPPFRPEDLAAHTYPHNLPRGAPRPPAPRAHGGDRGEPRRPSHDLPGRAQRLRRAHAAHPRAARVHRRHQRRSPLQRAAQGRDDLRRALRLVPYHPDYADVRRPGASKILEIPITSATLPGLPKVAGAGLRAPQAHPLARRVQAPGPAAGMAASVVHAAGGHARLRRSPAARGRALLQHHLPLQRGAARGQPLHAGREERGPLPRRPAAPARAPDGAASAPPGGRTRSSRASGRDERPDGHAAPAAPPGRERAAAASARPGPGPARPRRASS